MVPKPPSSVELIPASADDAVAPEPDEKLVSAVAADRVIGGKTAESCPTNYVEEADGGPARGR
jgi:hypothetical protein